FDAIDDGEPIEVRGGQVLARGSVVTQGVVQEPEQVRAANEKSRADIGEALEAFARNTIEHMLEEQELLSGRIELPRFDTDFRDRPVLIVVRGVDHESDLQALRPYIRDVKPVLVGVDGGANAILEAGFAPDMIVGDMDSAQERTLRCGAELVVHAYPDGRAPGRDHLESLGLAHKVVPAPGTSQDIAMLIAAEKGAELIVSVGAQLNLMEFLDKNRRGMSSTFLTRLRLGEIIVDAKGVSRLYRPLPRAAPIGLVLATGLVTLAAVVLLTPGLREVADLLWLKLRVLLGYEL
ncbi:putative cytokinetic ring protein SteA, partial [Paraconexibacter sp.]|uniref:putative cytokinetic ring protein SteA n=1 Tax=Paraconexibacter sp. TaxID=2949640 RepID=UPI00356662C8